MPGHLSAVLALSILWLWMLVAAAPPKAPEFLRAPHFMTERDELWVELRIEPHQDIRAVVLEAWGGEMGEFACAPEPLFLVRGSSEPVNEANPTQRTFRYHWRQAFAEGCYVLLAKSVLPRGVTRERKQVMEVR